MCLALNSLAQYLNIYLNEDEKGHKAHYPAWTIRSNI